jgi:uncharacterized membrane protein
VTAEQLQQMIAAQQQTVEMLRAVLVAVQVVVLMFGALVGAWFAWRFVRG